LIDQRIGEADRVLQRRRVFQSGEGRLRTQVRARVGQPAAGEFECGIFAQDIQIVGVFIAARDGENARPDHVRERVGDARGIASIGKEARQPLGNPETTLGHRQQHDSAIRRKPSAIESGRDLFAGNGWKRKRRETIIRHGERGVCDAENGLASTPKSYAPSAFYATLASFKSNPS
jgi:hypothetical protein